MTKVKTNAPTGRNGEVTGKALNLLWARSGGRCQFDTCKKDLTSHLVSGTRNANKAYVAHMFASSVNGPRGDSQLSKSVAKNVDNAILLCDGCHRVIDRERPNEFSVDRLRKMKIDHEKWVQAVLSLGYDSKSEIVRFTNKIEENETSIPIDMCVEALTGIGKTPAELHPVDLKVGVTDLTDLSDSFWIEEARALRSFFDKRLGQFSSGRTRHVSVFGFAPMPLLVLFGRLLSDLNDVEVFSRLREPKPSWKWLDEPSKLSPELKEGVSPAGRVALKICITDRISDERVIQSVGDHDLSIWEISCAKPGYDVLRTREDLSLFRMVVRNAFNRIKEVHGEAVDVLVFPAAPAACCIEFGRVWQPKTHRPMRIFDQQKDKGFVDCLRIE